MQNGGHFVPFKSIAGHTGVTGNYCLLGDIHLLSSEHIHGFVQDCRNSSVLAMELLQSCTKPSISAPGSSTGPVLMYGITWCFLHDQPWISPWIKSISNELDTTISHDRITIGWSLWCHQQSIVLMSSVERKPSEWDMGTMCKARRFYSHLWIRHVV